MNDNEHVQNTIVIDTYDRIEMRGEYFIIHLKDNKKKIAINGPVLVEIVNYAIMRGKVKVLVDE